MSTTDPVTAVTRLLVRADDVRKAAPARSDAEVVREQVVRLLDTARDLLDEVEDADVRRELAAGIARRVGDLDHEAVASLLGPTPDVAPAPTTVDDPVRVPPGQHLTAGWPVLHVGRAPDWAPADWRLVVTGHVEQRTVLDLAALTDLPTVTLVRDFHCVTHWSRLDNAWTGVRVADVLRVAGVRDTATHAVVSGHPAYSTNLHLDVLQHPDVVLAWDHDGRPLAREHGGPVRLVVPQRYGWKSVKWVTEIRLIDRDVPGYWEERGYHDVADPWREERYRTGGADPVR